MKNSLKTIQCDAYWRGDCDCKYYCKADGVKSIQWRKYIILSAFLLFAALANAQTKPEIKTDTAAIVNKAYADYKAALERFNPVWLLTTNGKSKVRYVAGFQRGDGALVDVRKAPLPERAIVFGVAVRKEKLDLPFKTKPLKP